jgi:hypothetical protein
MITICVLPNFKGTTKEFILCTITCLLLDAMYIVPMILDYNGL